MSIEDLIDEKVSEGALFEVVPFYTDSEPVRRRVLLVEDLRAAIYEPEENVARFAQLRVALESIVSGIIVTPNIVKCVEPLHDGDFAVRSKRPKPSIRVLGRFAQRDVLVLTNWFYRSEVDGKKDKRGWGAHKRICNHNWKTLFPDVQPMKSTKLSDLMSGVRSNDYYK